jgi:uncharacterized protein with beta-barrel porin domain
VFFNFHLNYGKAFINTQRNLNNQVAYGKTTGDIFRTRIETSFKKDYSNNLVVPRLGISFDKFKIKGYQELGSALNTKVSCSNGKRVAANLGISFKRLIKAIGYDIVPEIHFNMDRILSTSNGTTVITTIEDNPQTLLARLSKPSKTTYTIGSSLNIIRVNNIDFGIGYDYSFKPGYNHHLGYGKIIFKF